MSRDRFHGKYMPLVRTRQCQLIWYFVSARLGGQPPFVLSFMLVTSWRLHRLPETAIAGITRSPAQPTKLVYSCLLFFSCIAQPRTSFTPDTRTIKHLRNSCLWVQRTYTHTHIHTHCCTVVASNTTNYPTPYFMVYSLCHDPYYDK